jgi:hypothetical protein
MTNCLLLRRFWGRWHHQHNRLDSEIEDGMIISSNHSKEGSMTKVFSLIAAAMVAVSLSTQAHASLTADVSANVQNLQTTIKVQMQLAAGLNWHVGDKASYALDIGGFIKGTSNNFVREDIGTAFWMEQDMDLSGQTQKVEALVNKSTGQVEKLLVNGQAQDVPKSDTEVLEMHEAKITVQAGTFDCVYAKIRDKGDQKITEAWINPKIVPMSGILKAIADSQYGKVTQEVTSMSFAVAPAPHN